MANHHFSRRAFLSAALGTVAATPVLAQVPGQNNQLHNPVHRMATAPSHHAQAAAQHPLDPALARASSSLASIQRNMRDYRCTMIKRERIDGVLNDTQYMFLKVRNRKLQDNRIVVPFSAYMYFLKPEGVKGREVIYVEGQNNGKMIGHEGGLTGRLVPALWLNPTGPIAMKGQLYPITDAGIEQLVVKLIERGTEEKKFGECEVSFHQNVKLNGRQCTLLQLKHPVRRAHFEFHLAQIFIDDELNAPIRYAAYDWPAAAGGTPQVIEEYTYVNLEVNVGLDDVDFDPKNKNYNFH